MLATPGRLPFADADRRWAVETKQDGQRCIVYAPGDGSLMLRSRGDLDITPAYPELHALGDALRGRTVVLDGEIVAPDSQGRPDFERLQSRMGLRGQPALAARMSRDVPAFLVLFDIVHLDGSLTRRPYTERREVLRGLGLEGPAWSVPVAATGRSMQALEATRAAGLEGVVCKKLDSVYEPGKRSRSWIKVRNVRTLDAIVGGWVPGRGRLREQPGSVLLGQYRDGAFRYIGSVGTGWSDRERVELANLLHVAAISGCPFDPIPHIPGARWVLPRLVGEIAYATRTRAGFLRHPSWHRLRPDLAPDDIR